MRHRQAFQHIESMIFGSNAPVAVEHHRNDRDTGIGSQIECPLVESPDPSVQRTGPLRKYCQAPSFSNIFLQTFKRLLITFRPAIIAQESGYYSEKWGFQDPVGHHETHFRESRQNHYDVQ